MNTINIQAKPAKKLAINKETVRLLSSTQASNGAFWPSVNCTYYTHCTYNNCD